MKLYIQKRLLLLGTILALAITTTVFTIFIHRNFEETRIRTIENKLTGDASSILPHLYQSGNFAWFNANLDSLKQLGLTCLNIKDINNKTIWGSDNKCEKSISAKNYVDQKVLEIGYTLPKISLLSSITSNLEYFLIFLVFQSIFLFIAYKILSSINRKHTKALIELEHMKGVNESNDKIINLTRTLSHNLKSPLAALKTLYELSSDKLSADEKKLLNTIQKNIDLMASRLINQDDANIELSKVNVTKTVLETIKMKLIEHHEDKRFSLKSNIEGTFYSLINEFEFTNILSNLINNSIEAKKEYGPINVLVSVYQDNESITIEVKDDGKGVPNKNIENLFKFGVTSKTSGKGCGLYHARKTIELWKGKIKIESEENISTTVSIQIPLINFSHSNEIILIDNEHLNILSWKGMAQKQGIPFRGFSSPVELFKNISTIDKKSQIYVDYDLDIEDGNGLDLAVKLRNIGFKDIHLATGHSEKISDDFLQVSKNFPI
ncbi:MAG: sensor histidine kinase [Bacteriovoracaceae bacterium]